MAVRHRTATVTRQGARQSRPGSIKAVRAGSRDARAGACPRRGRSPLGGRRGALWRTCPATSAQPTPNQRSRRPSSRAPFWLERTASIAHNTSVQPRQASAASQAQVSCLQPLAHGLPPSRLEQPGREGERRLPDALPAQECRQLRGHLLGVVLVHGVAGLQRGPHASAVQPARAARRGHCGAHLRQDLHLELALHLRDCQAGVQAVCVRQDEQLGRADAQEGLRQALVPALPVRLAGRQLGAPSPPAHTSEWATQPGVRCAMGGSTSQAHLAPGCFGGELPPAPPAAGATESGQVSSLIAARLAGCGSGGGAASTSGSVCPRACSCLSMDGTVVAATLRCLHSPAVQAAASAPPRPGLPQQPEEPGGPRHLTPPPIRWRRPGWQRTAAAGSGSAASPAGPAGRAA